MPDTGYTQPDLTLLGAEHVERYRATDGAEGYLWNGATTLLLTVTGRSSGLPRTTPLIFARDGEDYLVVASQGGAPTDPQWYKNLLVDPSAEIRVLADEFAVTARTATDDEKPRLWGIVTDQWPNYDLYQSRTDRAIPVVVLTPSATPHDG